jgi:hypothetical protein
MRKNRETGASRHPDLGGVRATLRRSPVPRRAEVVGHVPAVGEVDREELGEVAVDLVVVVAGLVPLHLVVYVASGLGGVVAVVQPPQEVVDEGVEVPGGGGGGPRPQQQRRLQDEQDHVGTGSGTHVSGVRHLCG